MNNNKIAALAVGLAGLLAQSPALAETRIAMWVHSGAGPEADAYAASADAFNAGSADIKIDLVRLPEGSYGNQISAAALARKLPCVLEFDGPNVYNYAWSKKIVPLDGYPELARLKDSLLPSLQQQGTYAGRLYTLAQFDSGLAIWGNRKLLTQAGVRIPAGLDDAWKLDEFETALVRLKQAGVPYPLDMKFNYGVGEWSSYGFAPIVQSFGGDLIERVQLRRATGLLNGEASVKALTALQGWIKAGYVNAATKDDSDFVKGRAALSYVGHWVYRDYRKALGSDLVLIPMPRFGARAVTAAGSWNLGISSDCKSPEAAAKVLAFLMTPAEINRITDANGAIPATTEALAASRDYRDGGPLRLYVEQLRRIAVVRPKTPAYPAISGAFAEALNNIAAGADVKHELDRAAKKIDENIEDNKGYVVR
ncbi:extracellular solute-binding protein [Derxia lacustris]|uniref:extracellular solute-binding protein n=1 Tax=Derxia lacustris TaxID=764842 RepID=UPI000A16D073|nr:extracellular solute-binding protein [Derxia lacustris]